MMQAAQIGQQIDQRQPDLAAQSEDTDRYIWRTLFNRLEPLLREHAVSDYLKGLDILGFSAGSIPTLEDLNAHITPRTGWTVIPTQTRYAKSYTWFGYFTQRQFIVSNHFRPLNELDSADDPDRFHDIFGHLPLLVHPKYTRLMEAFGKAFLRAQIPQYLHLSRLWWNSFEKGLLRENGALKLFGGAALSSYEAAQDIISGNIVVYPFEVERVIEWESEDRIDGKSVRFAFESVESLEQELSRYFDSIT
jgi:phenylalanine-4-hydroxylase